MIDEILRGKTPDHIMDNFFPIVEKNGQVEKSRPRYNLYSFPLTGLCISSFSLHFLPLSPFPHSLSISYIKICHILSQNVKYGTFVANITKILTYALWGNYSGSNLLRGSSASCAGLHASNFKCSSLDFTKRALSHEFYFIEMLSISKHEN